MAEREGTRRFWDFTVAARSVPREQRLVRFVSYLPVPRLQLAQYYWPLTADGQPKFREVEAKDRSAAPILDANGNPTFNRVPVGDAEKFMEIVGVLSLTSFR